MKLTKNIVPLPYSDCLLTDTNLKTVSEVIYPDGGSLRQAIKVSCMLSITSRYVVMFCRSSTKTTNAWRALTPLSHIVATFSNVSVRFGERKRVYGVRLTLRHGNATTLCLQNLDGVLSLGKMALRWKKRAIWSCTRLNIITTRNTSQTIDTWVLSPYDFFRCLI